MINIDGLISGIDTETIIKGLLEVQQKQLNQFTVRKQTVEAKRSAFQAVEAQLLSLRSAAGALSRTQSNPFDARSITVSHENAVVASAQSRAAAGVYQVRINSLARAHQVATQGFDDADATITEGTLTLRVGNGAETVITIDSSNNTLSGLAETINFAKAGVTASVVQDGTSGTPYKLLLTSSKTGESGAISVTNNLADTAGSVIKPTFDFDNPVQEATSASVQLGEGTGALTVTSETNQVSNLISGVTLNLLEADPDRTITINVNRDQEKAVTAVKDFVNAYNGFLSFVDQITEYDAAADQAAILTGDRSLLDIRNQLQQVVQSVVPGGNTRSNRLSALGITTSDDGKLVVNESRLRDVVSGNVEGVSSADLRKLFALDGTSSTSQIEFLVGSSKTKDSTTPYEVNITQAAERASITAGNPLAASTVIDSSNRELKVSIDGLELSVTLNEGTYTQAELANHLEKIINAQPGIGGRSVAAGVDGSGHLTLRSNSFGVASKVSVVSGSALGAFGLSGGETDIGTDVAGYFVVNGKIEAAKGSGRILTGLVDNEHTADLQVRVTLSPGQVVSGVEGQLTISRGVTAKLDELIGKITNSESGLLSTVDERLNDQIESIQKTIDRQQATFDLQQESLIKQFTALETQLAQLQSTSSALGTQLASLGQI